MSALVMILWTAVILVVVKYGLITGLERVALALGWSAKARGQATGFATSAPELVVLTAAGLSGVWEAGLWNIASSNIINVTLMMVAVVRYGQVKELVNKRFIDEIAFAVAAIILPIALMNMGLDRELPLVPGLLVFFVIYRIVDRRFNPPAATTAPAIESVGNLPLGLIMTVTALVCVAVAGVFLGAATEDVVHEIGVHPVAAGWILGFVTSLPEMVTFFAVYGTAKREGRLDELEDTQEVLDNLTASNMANVGIVFPIGLGAYLLASGL
jgi:Ca2+/Na+ antiporter